ncbi:MAG: hypothetical protein HDS51_06220 [Barnesiella sp.]|nr:hypothetical protein [Barnesiella sp.]
MFYNQAKKEAIKRLQNAESHYNSLGQMANDFTLNLYTLRKSASLAIDRIEKYINTLANTPKEFDKEVHEVKLNIREFKEATRIEAENISDNIKAGGAAAGGVAAGGAVAALGPTAAMAIATTFGTASTGTMIASLSGAAATNAALAWLGGGALAAGGGGMAAGNAFLALAGPVGWGIAGIFVVGGSLFAAHRNRKAAEEAQKVSIEIEQRISVLQPKVSKLIQLIEKTDKLKSALNISLMVNTYPKDYLTFSNEQKESLAALINNVRAMGQLINERIY